MNAQTTQSQTVLNLDEAHTKLERIMLELPKTNSPKRKQHRMYLAGVIDTWGELGVVSSADRGTLYAQYCG